MVTLNLKSSRSEFIKNELRKRHLSIFRYHGDSDLHALITAAVRVLMNDDHGFVFIFIYIFVWVVVLGLNLLQKVTIFVFGLLCILNDTSRCGFDAKLDFLNNISNIPFFDIYIMPIVGSFMSRIVGQDDAQTVRRILKFYAGMCNKRRSIWKHKGNNGICYNW